MEVEGMHGRKPQAVGEWSTGFCDCCSNCSNCCVTLCCPCITLGQIAEIVDGGTTSCGMTCALYTLIDWFTLCGCMYACCYRTKVRKQYNLKGSDCGDCLKHFFCNVCALTQIYRELNNRGFDVALGWQGRNVQNGVVAMDAPVAESGMRR